MIKEADEKAESEKVEQVEVEITEEKEEKPKPRGIPAGAFVLPPMGNFALRPTKASASEESAEEQPKPRVPQGGFALPALGTVNLKPTVKPNEDKPKVPQGGVQLPFPVQLRSSSKSNVPVPAPSEPQVTDFRANLKKVNKDLDKQ